MKPAIQIAVIADTHGKLPASAAAQLGKADEIWHLGDFCDLATLNAIIGLGRPFYGILGNNDYGLALPSHRLLERCGKSFFLIHIPPSKSYGADFVLHGHTHVPRDEEIAGSRVLNPGSLGKANKGAPASWAWLRVEGDGSVDWNVVRV